MYRMLGVTCRYVEYVTSLFSLFDWHVFDELELSNFGILSRCSSCALLMVTVHLSGMLSLHTHCITTVHLSGMLSLHTHCITCVAGPQIRI